MANTGQTFPSPINLTQSLWSQLNSCEHLYEYIIQPFLIQKS